MPDSSFTSIVAASWMFFNNFELLVLADHRCHIYHSVDNQTLGCIRCKKFNEIGCVPAMYNLVINCWWSFLIDKFAPRYLLFLFFKCNSDFLGQVNCQGNVSPYCMFPCKYSSADCYYYSSSINVHCTTIVLFFSSSSPICGSFGLLLALVDAKRYGWAVLPKCERNPKMARWIHNLQAAIFLSRRNLKVAG